jgi:hypothetical protein
MHSRIFIVTRGVERTARPTWLMERNKHIRAIREFKKALLRRYAAVILLDIQHLQNRVNTRWNGD